MVKTEAEEILLVIVKSTERESWIKNPLKGSEIEPETVSYEMKGQNNLIIYLLHKGSASYYI